MLNIPILTNSNYTLYAARSYENINCSNTKEFYDDLEKIIYIKKIFNKYKRTGEIQHRLVLNHLIVLYNVFDHTALSRILFLKLDKYHSILKPFLIFLNLIPEVIVNINSINVIYTNDIIMDRGIIEILRQIKR
ncbi:MAG: hypothetical protein NTZ20_04770 [Candidatus Levybacteria bacterium]|nr:hypothetical protein [Candidatus Levybacteria bacterium]